MASKTLWVNFEKKQGLTYSINVPAEQPVFQVHRIQGGINFVANAEAMKTLSPQAYMLYMLLISRSIGRVWSLSDKSILKRTTLAQNDLTNALQELNKHGYWTPGKIDMEGNKFNVNTFHIWESPSLNPNRSISASDQLCELPAENETLSRT